MLFSYNWLKDYLKGRVPNPQKLADILTMHFFEVEEVKKNKDDWILDIDILPNRGDCLSHLGVAKECAALINSGFCLPRFSLKEEKGIKTKDFVRVRVDNNIDCPRYTARLMTDIKVGPSPRWLKERLEVCGLRSINNVVDAVNYVMLETGQPLHTFDFDKLEGKDDKSKTKDIIVRRAKKKEKIVTLEDEEYKLDSDILVIADSRKPVAIAGIKGGKVPEISGITKNIIIESANFNPGTIHKASVKLKLRTDASVRFEHGIDPNLTKFAIDRACFLIKNVAGGKIANGLLDVYPRKIYPKKIRLDLDYVERLLGTGIKKSEIINILKKLEFEVLRNGKREIIVKVPTSRQDVDLPENLIEEIGRVYGFDKIPPVFPLAALVPPKRNLKIFWEDAVKDILKEAGFTEVYNYSFFSEREARVFGYLSTGKGRVKLIELKNPVNAEERYLRPSLIPGLLRNVKTNLNLFGKGISFENLKIQIFEIGKVFQRPRKEKTMLAGLVVGDSFYQAKGVVDLLLNKLGISDVWYDNYQPTPEESLFSIWHPKKCAEIKVGFQEIGFLGEVSPRILKELGLPKLTVFDINFEILARLASEEHEFRPLSRYPAVIRDLSIIVPRDVLVVEVLNKINTEGGPLVRDVDLFDIYESEELGTNKKSFAFHIVYQATDRALSTEEVNKIHQKIISVLEKNPEWEVRK